MNCQTFTWNQIGDLVEKRAARERILDDDMRRSHLRHFANPTHIHFINDSFTPLLVLLEHTSCLLVGIVGKESRLHTRGFCKDRLYMFNGLFY